MQEVELVQEQTQFGHTVIRVLDAGTGSILHTEARMYAKDGIHGRPEPMQDVYARAVSVCTRNNWQVLASEKGIQKMLNSDDKKPVHVRKFWIETACKAMSPHATGPVRDNGFTTTVKVKYNGEPYKAVEIHGIVDKDDGSLLLTVTIYTPDGDMIGHIMPFEQDT